MKDALGHGSNPRKNRPLGDHHYHRKTNAELHYIMKDASEAAKATRGMSSYNPNSGKREDTEGKYLDQVNDAATVIGWRDRTGAGPDAGFKSDAAAAEALAGGGAKSAPVATHDAMTDTPNYFSRVSAKNGRAMGVYGPHASREHAAAEAFGKHPKAKTVSTYRGSGMDIRWQNR